LGKRNDVDALPTDQLLSVTTSLKNIFGLEGLEPLLTLKILLSQPLETPVWLELAVPVGFCAKFVQGPLKLVADWPTTLNLVSSTLTMAVIDKFEASKVVTIFSEVPVGLAAPPTA
jgi:hypothetical protein